jgi:hypothetical protein
MRLYAVPGAHNVIDTINEATGQTTINGHTFEQVLAREPLAKLFTWEEWRATQIERQQTPITWEPTTEEKYNEMLNVLPPEFWRMGLFLVGEPYDHDYATGAPRFTAYWERRKSSVHYVRYSVASRPITIAEADAIVRGAL